MKIYFALSSSIAFLLTASCSRARTGADSAPFEILVHKNVSGWAPFALLATRNRAGRNSTVNPDGIHLRRAAFKESGLKIKWSIEGINGRDTSIANNNLRYEPSDQGLCAGNGFFMHTVNCATQVYNAKTGKPLTNVISTNEFFHFPPEWDDKTKSWGKYATDPSCHYDPDTDRWFHVVAHIEVNPVTRDFTGPNYLNLAVSKSGDPTGKWDIYRIPATNDGTEGTPNHQCDAVFCVGDFPQFGMNKDGIFITTNEYSLFNEPFYGAQVYAISKPDLVDGKDSITAYLFDTHVDPWKPVGTEYGGTVWPAKSAGTQFDKHQKGTQYFVSGNAEWDISSTHINIWALTNTQSLQSSTPALKLTNIAVKSQYYEIPPPSVQKEGSIPLGKSNYSATKAGAIDTLDARILDVRFADGKLWAVLCTGTTVSRQKQAGVAWFILVPSVSKAGVTAKMLKQGVLAMKGESLVVPTVGVTTNGKGIIGFTRVGKKLYPSQGYASIDAVSGVGPVSMSAMGNAPNDGYKEYQEHNGVIRPRWGDYSAAAIDGKYVYIVNGYIEQGKCSVKEFMATECNRTRSFWVNWSSRITKTKL